MTDPLSEGGFKREEFSVEVDPSDCPWSLTPTEHGRKVSLHVSLPTDEVPGPFYINCWTDPAEPYEAKSHVQDGPTREGPSRENFWRVVEYHCASCKQACIVDHVEDAAKYRECRDCARVPQLDQPIRDHRRTSLLWVHQIAAVPPSERACPVLPPSRERSDRQHDRAATQRTRPGTDERSESARPVSRTVAARDSAIGEADD